MPEVGAAKDDDGACLRKDVDVGVGDAFFGIELEAVSTNGELGLLIQLQ